MTKLDDCAEALELAENVSPYRARNGEVFVDLMIKGHRETWDVQSDVFKNWLRNSFLDKTGRALKPEVLKSATLMLQARAGQVRVKDVYVRTAEVRGCIYIDLGDDRWRAVRVTAKGWSIVRNVPVRFRRTPSMEALPRPTRGAKITDLRPLLGKMSDQDFVLVVFWMLTVLRGRSPYPVLSLCGAQGSAKSTTARIVQALVDPSFGALRALPTCERDLFLAATQRLVLSFDNLSVMSSSISDVLCRISTGAAYGRARHYSNKDEYVLAAAAPIILNGIINVVERPDLAERAVFVRLAPLSAEERTSERDIEAKCRTSKAGILGSLLDGLVEGLKNQKNIKGAGYARMFDFAQWSMACETAYWPQGTFETAYREMTQETAENFAESDPIVANVVAYILDACTFHGTAQELLNALNKQFEAQLRGDRQWPKNPRAFSGRLRRVVPVLASLGVQVEFGGKEGRNRDRMIDIKTTNETHCQSPAIAERPLAPNPHKSPPVAKATGMPVPRPHDVPARNARARKRNSTPVVIAAKVAIEVPPTTQLSLDIG